MDDIQFQKGYSALVASGYAAPAGKTAGVKKAEKTPGKEAAPNGDFARILQQTLTEKENRLVFSKHAMQRIDSRGIRISPQLLTRMNTAAQDAGAKGIRDALMISGQTAFIVNIPSRTVVTTMSGQEMQNNIFTKIDGAVVL